MPASGFTNLTHLFLLLVKRVNSTTVRKLIGLTAKQMIYKRVKSGYGVVKEGKHPDQTKAQRLSPLSASYIAYRKGRMAFYRGRHGKVYATTNPRYIKKPRLGRFGSPTRSNLTLSGRMLDALTYDTRVGSITIRVKNTRRQDDKLTNAQVARMVSENGRPWLALTRTEWRILDKQIRTIISKEVQKIFS